MSKKEDELKSVLLVVDGSTTSDKAAEFALRYAAKTGAPVLAVFTIDTATMDYLLQMRIFVEEEREDFEKSLELKGKNYLLRLMEIANQYNVNIDTQLCRGRFHQAIINVADKIDANMVIIGGWHNNSRHRDNFHTEHELLLALIKRPLLVVK